MNTRIPIIAVMLFLAAITLSSAQSSPCSTSVYLTLYNTTRYNASVGIDNLSVTAFLSKFIYNNATSQCVIAGIPTQNISFYLTSANSSSVVYNTLYGIGTATTNSTGYALLLYNSSKIGPGRFLAIARFYGNSTAPSAQSNIKNISLVFPVAQIITSCSVGCGNVITGGKFTVYSTLCVGRPPFSWSTCYRLANQRLIFNASFIFLANANTNSSGVANITYRTSLLPTQAYDVFSVWRGGTKYANITASSYNDIYNLIVSPKPINTTTTTTVNTTTTTTPSQGLSQSDNTALIYIELVIIIVLIAMCIKQEMDIRKIRRKIGMPRNRPIN